MFSIGEQLYRLTSRDEETLLVEPFFRSIGFQLVGAAAQAVLLVPIPVDRCLYIKSVTFTGGSYAGGTWSRAQIAVENNALGSGINVVDWTSFVNGLVTDRSNNAVTIGERIVLHQPAVDTLYPPGLTNIRLNAQTPAKAVTADVIFDINGYLLPPGRIGRR